MLHTTSQSSMHSMHTTTSQSTTREQQYPYSRVCKNIIYIRIYDIMYELVLCIHTSQSSKNRHIILLQLICLVAAGPIHTSQSKQALKIDSMHVELTTYILVAINDFPKLRTCLLNSNSCHLKGEQLFFQITCILTDQSSLVNRSKEGSPRSPLTWSQRPR